MLSRGDARAFDQIDYDSDRLVGIAGLITYYAGLGLPDAGVELLVTRRARWHVVDVAENSSAKEPGLDD